jgi:molybdopterin-guanine dinucleotide biosynthesis protein A
MSSQPTHINPPRTGLFMFPALMYGVLLCGFGFTLYFLSVVLRFVTFLLDPHNNLLGLIEGTIWYSGMPVAGGLIMILFDLFVLLPWKRTRVDVRWDPLPDTDLTVVLTAYNDEPSIAMAVEDFRRHPKVKRVIVVDNNSTDHTAEVARDHGAIVVQEQLQGYGHCVFRALTEGANYSDTELTLLCEGDMTFRAYDIDKLLSFVPHTDIVNGTRIVEQLRELHTQVTTFIYYGNFLAGKLLEAKHLGAGTLTDVGTTYKLCRNDAIRRLLPLLNREINLEFNAYFLDSALTHGFSVVECPVTFYARVGVSKGGNVSNWRALTVGLRMILGITLSWRLLPWLK